MKKNALAILIGCLISLGLFVGAEVFFQFNESYHWLAPLKKRRPQGVTFDNVASANLNYLVKDGEISKWKPLLNPEDGPAIAAEGHESVAIGGRIPCCIFLGLEPMAQKFYVELYSRVSKKLIAISHYSLDDYGRRITPQRKNPKQNILMFGDSYTLGENINDQETSPYQLGLLRGQTQVINFGLAGGSPNEVLYELANDPGKRLGGIAKVPTTVLYSYIDHHLERLICRSNCLRSERNWWSNRPYYELENGQLTFKGFFNTDRVLRNQIYNVLNSSAVIRFFNIIWPLQFTQKDFDLFAEVVLAAKNKASERFTDVDFYLVLYPGSSEVYSHQVRQACEERGIKVLDYSRIKPALATNNNHEIPGDGHPSPVTQYLFARLLDRDLPQ